MPATKFTATAPNGQIVTRSSKTKTYAFAIIVRDSYEIALASAQRAGLGDVVASNFAHYRAYLDGTSRFLARKSYETDDAKFAARTAYDVENATNALGGAATVEDYREMLRAKAVAHVEAAKVEGKYDDYGAYAWSSRRDLAEKAAQEARNRGVFAEVIITPVN